MSSTDEALQANQLYAAKFNLGDMPMLPRRKLVVLTCMDARMTIENVLGLKAGDAHVLRNAGAIATEDTLRSLILSHHLQGTQEFMVIGHTECAMLRFDDAELLRRLETQSGAPAVTPVHFYSFKDLKESVRQQVARIRNHPYIPQHISVRGFVYDVKTGKLEEVAANLEEPVSQTA